MLQSLAEFFSRDLGALIPLAFQRAMFTGEHLGNFRDHLRYQRICLLDRRTWFIDKFSLNLSPTRAKLFRFDMVKQGF